MDGHPTLVRGWTESRLQAGSPSPIHSDLLTGQRANVDRRNLLQDVHRPGDHQAQDDQGTRSLDRHGEVGPPGDRHHISWAERGGVRESKVEVVEKLRSPSWPLDPGIEVLGKGQIRELRRPSGPCLRAFAVKLPVEKREADNQVEPDQGSNPEKLRR